MRALAGEGGPRLLGRPGRLAPTSYALNRKSPLSRGLIAWWPGLNQTPQYGGVAGFEANGVYRNLATHRPDLWDMEFPTPQSLNGALYPSNSSGSATIAPRYDHEAGGYVPDTGSTTAVNSSSARWVLGPNTSQVWMSPQDGEFWTFLMWVKSRTIENTRAWIAGTDGQFNTRGWGLYWENDPTDKLRAYNGVWNTVSAIDVGGSGTVTNEGWQRVGCYLWRISGTNYVQAILNSNLSGTIATNTQSRQSDHFELFGNAGRGQTGSWYNACLWRRKLTQAELNWDYDRGRLDLFAPRPHSPVVVSTGSGAITGSGTPSVHHTQTSGAGDVLVKGTGAPQAHHAQTVGAGDVFIDGAGTPQVHHAQTVGAGTTGVNQGTGALQVHRAQTSGAGDVVVDGAGTPQVHRATVSGAGAVVVSGAGTLQVHSAQVGGAGAVVVSGSGTLQVHHVQVSGVADTGIAAGTGALQAHHVQVAGAGTSIVRGTGALSLHQTQVSGAAAAIVKGAGTLSVHQSVISGAAGAVVKGSGAVSVHHAQTAGNAGEAEVAHRRESIMAALHTSILAGLTTTGSNVFRNHPYEFNDDNQLPCLNIIQGPEEAEGGEGDVHSRIYRTLEVVIEARAQALMATLPTTLNLISKEIAVAIHADYTLGLSFVVDTSEISTREMVIVSEGSKPVGQMDTVLLVQYSTSRTDPSA